MEKIIQDARNNDNMQKFIHKDNKFFIETYKQILKPIVNSYNVSVIDNETIILIKNENEWWITISFYKEEKSYRIIFECYQNDLLREDIEALFHHFNGLEIQFNVHNEAIVMLLNQNFFKYHNFEEPELLELIQLTYLSNLKKSGNLSFEKLKSIQCINEKNISLYKRLSNSIFNYFWSESNGQTIEKLFCKSMFQDSYLTFNNKHAKEFFNFKFTNYTSTRKRRVEKELLLCYEQQDYPSKLIWNKGSHPKLLLSKELVEILSNRYFKIEQILFQASIGEHKIPYLRFSKQEDNKYLINIVERDTKLPIYNVKESAESMIEKLKQFAELDIMRVSLQRREQQFLRRFLFHENDTEQCAICGKEFPISFLVAAHIKPRSKCNDSEKMDFRNIVVPMCKFGCDELFERGYISVQQGKVVSISKNKSTQALNEYILTLIGKECIQWSKDNQKYYQWHYNYHMNKK
jgi:hypothetical protein